MPIWLFQLILLFAKEVLKEILEDVDWSAAKVQFEAWARKMTPGDRFDDAAAFMAGIFFDILASVLKKNPSLTFKAAAKIARRELPMALARAAMAKGA